MSNVVKDFALLPLSWLHPQQDELKIRPVTKDGAYLQLVDSIREAGIITPFLVIPMKDKKDEYTVLGGNRRLEAVKDVYTGKPEPKIPCVIGPANLSRLNQVVLATMDNLHRKNLTPAEILNVDETLKQMGITTQEKRAKLLGISPSYLSEVLSGKGRIQRGGPVRSRPSTRAVMSETFRCPKCGADINRAWDDEEQQFTYALSNEK